MPSSNPAALTILATETSAGVSENFVANGLAGLCRFEYRGVNCHRKHFHSPAQNDKTPFEAVSFVGRRNKRAVQKKSIQRDGFPRTGDWKKPVFPLSEWFRDFWHGRRRQGKWCLSSGGGPDVFRQIWGTLRDPLFLTPIGFFPFPRRTGLGSGLKILAGRAISVRTALVCPGGVEGKGPLESVSFTRCTSASDIKGLAIVATTFGQRSAVAIISGTWPDIITMGIRAVASF